MQDVFAIQDEIALAIVDKLKVKLLSDEKRAMVKRHTENLDAYHLYLRGRYFWHRWPEGFLPKALECFQQAIAADPNYALPYAGLADAYSILGFWQFMAPGDAFPVARAMAEKALEIDDTLAEAHTSLALTQLAYEWDWAAAERGFKRAIELNPGYSLAHIFYAHYLVAMGRQDEAIAETYQAQELDPLSLLVNVKVGFMLCLAREYEAALEQLQKTLELDPRFGFTHFFIGACYVGMRRYEEAISAIQQAIEVTGEFPQAVEFIGYVYARMGERDKARKILDECEARMKQSYVPATAPALIYLGLGEDEKVFEWLNRAYEQRGPAVLLVAASPEFDPVRSDPRFQDLLRRLGLAP
jgi:tetratricopeptide (TPR) repeat protein